MSSVAPVYTRENCVLAYQLFWELVVYWRFYVYDATWLSLLKQETGAQGLQVLKHRFLNPGVSRFEVSTTPDISPRGLAEIVRGQLQNLVRDQFRQALKPDYRLQSIGTATREEVEGNVESQLDQLQIDDVKARESFRRFQIVRRDADLSVPQRSPHAIYWYNLHVVLENDGDRDQLEAVFLRKIHDMILEESQAKGNLISRAAILPDHVEMTLGCDLNDSPADVVLEYMNQLACVCGMQPVLRFGAYVNTFGETTTGAHAR